MSEAHHNLNRRRGWLLILSALLATASLRAQSVRLDLGSVAGADWRARDVRMALAAGGGARLEVAGFEAFGRRYENLRLTCARFDSARGTWRCEDGVLEGPEKLGISFAYTPATRAFDLRLTAGIETWQLAEDGGRFVLDLTDAALARLADWLPGDIKPTAGRASGRVIYSPRGIEARLAVKGAAFANPSGLAAGENLGGQVSLAAEREGSAWRWRGEMQWNQGALLFDPLYIAEAGHALEATGRLADRQLAIEHAALLAHGIGRVEGAARIDLAGAALLDWNLDAQGLLLPGLRSLLPQAWLDEHRLSDLALAGRVSVSAAARGADFARIAVRLDEAAAKAAQREIGIEGVELDFRHAPGEAAPFTFGFARAHLHGLAFGPATAEGVVRDARLAIPNFVVPVLDGVLAVSEIGVARPAGRWQAQLRGAFTPLSMQQLTAALGWHPMRGTLSGVLPQMHYAESATGSTFSVDGALLFKVFDGDAKVDGIRVDNLFGRTPHLAANLKLTGLDLETMTGAVKFGNITGKVDVSVDGLEMENWQPLSFDARIASSPGDYNKRISQRAVQNISSIGGAGAGAAIQASFLRFFETFGYERLGLSCRLVNGVCEMGGIAPASGAGAGSGFTIIKGGGLPALNVVGYNRFVGWQEMLDRIQAVIEGNSKMVVQ